MHGVVIYSERQKQIETFLINNIQQAIDNTFIDSGLKAMYKCANYKSSRNVLTNVNNTTIDNSIEGECETKIEMTNYGNDGNDNDDLDDMAIALQMVTPQNNDDNKSVNEAEDTKNDVNNDSNDDEKVEQNIDNFKVATLTKEERNIIYTVPTVPIRIYLNKDFNATKDFDKSNDVCIDVTLERDCDSNNYELEDLITDVKSKFRSHKKLKGTDIKNRLRDKTYNIIFLGYELNIQIDDADELTQEIEEIFPSDSESDHSDDNNNKNKIKKNIVELRIIFKELPIIIKPNPPQLNETKETEVEMSEFKLKKTYNFTNGKNVQNTMGELLSESNYTETNDKNNGNTRNDSIEDIEIIYID
eukprot:456325_1